MRIITLECPECETVVAGNVLEQHRVMKCLGLDCEAVHEFNDLPEDDRTFLESNPEKHRM